MNLTSRILVALALVAIWTGCAAAQTPAQGWIGEWGAFTRSPPGLYGPLDKYNGAGLSIRRGGAFVEQVKHGDGKVCIFEVIPTSAGITFRDRTGVCGNSECDGGNAFNGEEFSWRDKVKVASHGSKAGQ